MKQMPEQEFLKMLSRLFKYLLRHKKHEFIHLLKKIISDNQVMALQIKELKEQINEQGTTERREESASNSLES